MDHKESSWFHRLLYSQALLLCKHLLKLVLSFVLYHFTPSFFVLITIKQPQKVIPCVFFLVFIHQMLGFFLQINWLFKYQLQSHQLLKHISHLHRQARGLILAFMILYLWLIFCNLILLPVFFDNALGDLWVTLCNSHLDFLEYRAFFLFLCRLIMHLIL